MIYRELRLEEAELIKEIDPTWYIKNAWRKVDGQLKLVEINWTERELPNGLDWHINRLRETIRTGGKALGCFNEDVLVGYGTVNANVFGTKFHYVLLDQLFISKDYRNKGIGKHLVHLCAKQATEWNVDKLYICAASAEETMAFYRKIGCVDAKEINQELYEQDTNDIQLEYPVDCMIES